jgi:hypothetical protein
MSELQDLLVALDSVNREIEQQVAKLVRQAQQLNQAAAQASAVTHASSRAEGDRTAIALKSAQRAVSQAAQLLHQAALAGKGFVARNAGAQGGARGASPEFGPGTASPTASQALAAIGSWLPEINPGYTGDAFDPRSSNCGACAAAVFARLEGTMPAAFAGTRTLSVPEMEAFTGGPQVPMSPSAIRDTLIAAGPGSHAVIGIDRTIGPGHWFNAYYDGERVVAIDGQSGEIQDWPPVYGSRNNPVSNWDMGAL